MKKTAAVLACVVLLSGCGEITGSLSERLEEKTAQVLSEKIMPVNNRSKYYSYYLDPSVGRVYATDTGNVFSYEGITFAMNLDAGGIVNEKYYPEAPDSAAHQKIGSAAVKTGGTMTDRYGEEKDYEILITILDTGEYYVTTTASGLVFTASVTEEEAPVIAAEMLKIARSAVIDTSEVMAVYSSREGIDYLGTPVELFEEMAPVNGTIEELLVDYDGKSKQEEIFEDTDSQEETDEDEAQ